MYKGLENRDAPVTVQRLNAELKNLRHFLDERVRNYNLAAQKDVINILGREINLKVDGTTYVSDKEALDQAVADAQAAADAAQNSADDANSFITDMVSDNSLTPPEKLNIKKEWDIIVAEKTRYDASATAYGITTEKTSYNTNYTALNTYITPLLTEMTVTSSIDRATFILKFKNYYDSRQVLLNAITAKAKTLADAAQSTANTKKRVFTTQPVTPYDLGDLWTFAPDPTTENPSATCTKVCTTARASGAYVASDWTKDGLSQRISSAELKITPAAIVQAINTTDGVGKVKTSTGSFTDAGFEVSHSQSGTKSRMAADGFKVIRLSDNEEVAKFLDNYAEMERANIGELICPNVLTAVKQSTRIYVNSSTGNDTAEFKEGATYKTIQAAINRIPKHIPFGKEVRIDILAGTYAEEIVVSDFTGGGELRIVCATTGVSITGHIHAYGNVPYVLLFGGRSSYDTTDGARLTVNTYDHGIQVGRCSKVDCNGWVIKGVGNSSNYGGVYALDGSTVYAAHNDISSFSVALWAIHGATLHNYDNCGSDNWYSVRADAGGRALTGHNANTHSWIPVANVYDYVEAGIITTYGVRTPTASINNPPPAPPITVKSWTPTLSRSYAYHYSIWAGASQSSDGDVTWIRQGKYDTYGPYCGCFWFNRADMVANIGAEGDVQSAKIYMKRRASGGSSAGVNHHLFGISNGDATGVPNRTHDYGWIGSLAWGGESWFTFPTQAVKDLVAGRIAGFAFYEASGSYSYIQGTAYGQPILEVTYV